MMPSTRRRGCRPSLAAVTEGVKTCVVEVQRQTVEAALLKAQWHARIARVGGPGGPSQADDPADVHLLEAVSRGVSLGLVRTFLDEGPELLTLLGGLAGRRRDTALGRLLAIAAEEAAAPPLHDGCPIV